MRRYDPRLLFGVLLVLGGLLSLLDAMGVISNGGGIFWGLIFGAGGLIFLYILINNRENWWAAFPAFTLLGLAASSFLPESLSAFDGLVFFAGISLGSLAEMHADAAVAVLAMQGTFYRALSLVNAGREVENDLLEGL